MCGPLPHVSVSSCLSVLHAPLYFCLNKVRPVSVPPSVLCCVVDQINLAAASGNNTGTNDQDAFVL